MSSKPDKYKDQSQYEVTQGRRLGTFNNYENEVRPSVDGYSKNVFQKITSPKASGDQRKWAVRDGLKPGIYDSWLQAAPNVLGVRDAEHKRLRNEQEAHDYMNQRTRGAHQSYSSRSDGSRSHETPPYGNDDVSSDYYSRQYDDYFPQDPYTNVHDEIYFQPYQEYGYLPEDVAHGEYDIDYVCGGDDENGGAYVEEQDEEKYEGDDDDAVAPEPYGGYEADDADDGYAGEDDCDGEYGDDDGYYDDGDGDGYASYDDEY